jgi:hypothetical protein
VSSVPLWLKKCLLPDLEIRLKRKKGTVLKQQEILDKILRVGNLTLITHKLYFPENHLYIRYKILALITRLRNSEYLFACKFDDDPPSIACIWLLTSGAIKVI